MADPLTTENRLDWLNTIQRYFDSDLSPQELQSFNAALQESAALRRLFLQYSRQNSAIREVIGVRPYDSVLSFDKARSQVDDDDWILQLTNGSDHDANGQGESIDEDAITARMFFSLTGYLLRQALTTKLAYKAYGIAAAVLVAVTLFLVFGPGDDDTAADPLAGNQPADVNPVTPDVRPVPVATLTAERDATWAEGALAPGSQLRAGQRFTLTQGLAEITTQRGAVAIIEAPATIELIDSPNAIHLHTGKLVGICETASSKGFLVRTPHMDITDLGTHFGVDATRSEATEVHVFDGVVQAVVSNAPAPDEPTRLVAGESAQGSSLIGMIEPIDHDTKRFAAIMPTRIELPGTGQGLALKETDPNWRVTAIDGKPLDTPGTMTVRDAHDGRYDPPFLPNDPQTSQWLLIDGRLGQSGTGPVTFTCQSRFEIPPGVGPSAASLIVSFDADDSVTAVRINGQAVAVPENEFIDDSRDLHPMTIRRHLVAGENTIEFDVMDRRSLGFANSGLRVKLSLQPDEWKNER